MGKGEGVVEGEGVGEVGRRPRRRAQRNRHGTRTVRRAHGQLLQGAPQRRAQLLGRQGRARAGTEKRQLAASTSPPKSSCRQVGDGAVHQEAPARFADTRNFLQIHRCESMRIVDDLAKEIAIVTRTTWTYSTLPAGMPGLRCAAGSYCHSHGRPADRHSTMLHPRDGRWWGMG